MVTAEKPAAQTRPKSLTDRHFTFIDRMAVNGGNASDAAEFARFGKPYNRSGNRLLQRVDIRRQIEIRKQELAQSETATPEFVMQRLVSEARGGETSSARVAALRTLADILGMTSGRAGELPAALTGMLEALGRGLAAGQQASRPAIEATAREVADLNEESGQAGAGTP